MTIAGIFKQILDGFWLVGGIGASADLGLEDFGSGAYAPCPREDEYPYCSNQEACSCQVLSQNSGLSSPLPPSRCS